MITTRLNDVSKKIGTDNSKARELDNLQNKCYMQQTGARKQRMAY